MLRKAKIMAPSLAVAVLLLGLATPAFADVPPGPRERTKRTIEPHEAPPMTPPLEQMPPPEVEAPQPETEPPSQQSPETAAQPTTAAAPPQAQPEAKGEAEAATAGKSGSCSIDADSEQAIAGVAALVMLIAGAGLTRRKRAHDRW
jgi:outer membrane biosynthesis protein TonB